MDNAELVDRPGHGTLTDAAWNGALSFDYTALKLTAAQKRTLRRRGRVVVRYRLTAVTPGGEAGTGTFQVTVRR